MVLLPFVEKYVFLLVSCKDNWVINQIFIYMSPSVPFHYSLCWPIGKYHIVLIILFMLILGIWQEGFFNWPVGSLKLAFDFSI